MSLFPHVGLRPHNHEIVKLYKGKFNSVIVKLESVQTTRQCGEWPNQIVGFR